MNVVLSQSSLSATRKRRYLRYFLTSQISIYGPCVAEYVRGKAINAKVSCNVPKAVLKVLGAA